MTEGKIYKFKLTATNAIGESEKSEALYASLIAPPAAPASISRVETSSSKTSIAVTWATVADGLNDGGDIRGYELWIKRGPSASYELLYNGSTFPTIAS